MDYVAIVDGLLLAWTLLECIRWLAISSRCNQKLPPGQINNRSQKIQDFIGSEEDPQAIERNHIEHLCLDLFVAGTDTTSSTLEWAMVEVMRKPDIMNKAKSELAVVIGEGTISEEAHIGRLHYLQCIVKETLHMHPPVPFLIRKDDQDVEACGYFVPKDSQVLVHVWSISRDPAVWEDPLAFKPERFWDLKMDVRGQDFEIIPSGAGRRICPGIPLATRTLSVMLGSLLNSFDWSTRRFGCRREVWDFTSQIASFASCYVESKLSM